MIDAEVIYPILSPKAAFFRFRLGYLYTVNIAVVKHFFTTLRIVVSLI